MKKTELPSIQACRFDLETIHENALDLAGQASKGPTWVRHKGKIAFVMLTEELFDRLWPDPHRAWGTHEAPDRDFLAASAAVLDLLSEPTDNET